VVETMPVGSAQQLRWGAALPIVTVGLGVLGLVFVAWRSDLGLELLGPPVRRRRRSNRP